ncbi:MAG: hypothetical protein R8F63_17515 [Acidimicrobiales bacterium]|nr:hypothetical protein [Acidimicrobiales bacterium]
MTTPTTFAPNDPDLVAVGVQWAATADNSEIFIDRAFVRWLIAELEERRDWATVIAVARDTEQAMAQAGRWGTWRSILESARGAAIAADDRTALGWATHQLGTRNLLRDDLGAARADLHAALATREAIGDLGGIAATRHNLRILPLALAGVMTLLTLLVGLVAMLIPSFDHPEVPEPEWILDITDEVVTLEELQDPAFRIRLLNLGTVALEDLDVRSEDESVPVTGDLGACGTSIPIRQEPDSTGACLLALDVSAVTEDDLPLVVDVIFSHSRAATDGVDSIASQIGDSRVLIRSGG